MRDFKTYSFDQAFSSDAFWHLIKHQCPDFSPSAIEIGLAHLNVKDLSVAKKIEDELRGGIQRAELSKAASFVLVLTITPPISGSKDFSHSITAFVDTKSEAIEVHDPLPVAFPKGIKLALKNIFPNYDINENYAAIQKVSEASCRYISAKKVIAYASGLPFPSRESMQDDLVSDSQVISEAMCHKYHLERSKKNGRRLLSQIKIFASDVGGEVENNLSIMRNKNLRDRILTTVIKHVNENCRTDDLKILSKSFDDNFFYYSCENPGKHKNEEYARYKAELVDHFSDVFSKHQTDKKSSSTFFKEKVDSKEQEPAKEEPDLSKKFNL